MSYVRWSTEINGVMPINEELRLITEHRMKREDITKEQLRRGGELSVWYIYWHAMSPETRDDQVVSINLSGGECCVNLTYDDVVVRLERDFWDDLFPDRPQREVFDSALKSWIRDVEGEYPNG
jgi:hypothetical protein